MYTTRIEKTPGRRPVMRKLPSLPAKAPATVTFDALSRRVTDARGSGALAGSTILPRISKEGWGGAGEGDCAAARTTGSASDDVRRAMASRDTEVVSVEWVGTALKPARPRAPGNAPRGPVQSTWQY